MKKTKRPKQKKTRKISWKNNLEKEVGNQLKKYGFTYETIKLVYQFPPSVYTPDFINTKRKLIIETKGKFVLEDRRKHICLKEQHSEWEVRFVFSNSKTKLYKKGKMTYGGWCDKNGFLYADKEVPEEWLK